jgi:hypothetical protein
MYCTYLQFNRIAIRVCIVIIGIGIDRDLSPLMKSSPRVRSGQGDSITCWMDCIVLLNLYRLYMAVHLLVLRLKIKESHIEMRVGIPCQVTTHKKEDVFLSHCDSFKGLILFHLRLKRRIYCSLSLWQRTAKTELSLSLHEVYYSQCDEHKRRY